MAAKSVKKGSGEKKSKKAKEPLHKKMAAAKEPVRAQEAKRAVDSVVSIDGEEELLEEDAEGAAAEAPQSDADLNLSLTGAKGTPMEGSVSYKNFRHHPDMENFFRFIYENDLRFEALSILEQILQQKRVRKKTKVIRTRPH